MLDHLFKRDSFIVVRREHILEEVHDFGTRLHFIDVFRRFNKISEKGRPSLQDFGYFLVGAVRESLEN